MCYKVITTDKGLYKNERVFNSLKQAIEFIKSDVKNWTKNGFYRLIIERDDGAGAYKAIYGDKYNRARFIYWRVVECKR